MKSFILLLLISCCCLSSTYSQLTLRPDVKIPALPKFQALPEPDAAFSKSIARLVEQSGLDERTPAADNPDNEDEWSSICVVDISDMNNPRVGSWEAENFVYPASTYKLYILGETIRRVCEGTISLDDTVTVKEHNVRAGSHIEVGQVTNVAEILRLMMTYSDNSAANEAIDLVDRQQASALLRAMGCQGSDITRKYLSRTLEDDGYTTVPGTTSSALHFATFLWAVESGAIGGGRGRGLIKGYLAMIQTAQDRIRAGLPDSATLYSKSGTWNIFTSEVGIVEDGNTRYIICILTALPYDKANPRIAEFTRGLHEMMKK